jgi:hypothetical protein
MDIVAYIVGPMQVGENRYSAFTPVLGSVLQGRIADSRRDNESSRISGTELELLRVLDKWPLYMKQRQPTL